MKKLLNTIVLLAAFTSVIAQPISRLNADVAGLNATNVRTAFEDMRKIKGYDVARYESMLKEFEELCRVGFTGNGNIDSDNQVRAKKAFALKRMISALNPSRCAEVWLDQLFGCVPNALEFTSRAFSPIWYLPTIILSPSSNGFDIKIMRFSAKAFFART